MEITYRPMCEKDIERVAELEKICFSSPWSYKALFGELSNAVAYYIVALDGETVVGYAGEWIMFDEAHMTNIAVDPEYRMHGIARTMIIHLMREALRRGGERMTLEVRENNHRAQRLYASLDFAYAGMRKRYYTDTGENAFILWNDCIIETFEKHCGECSVPAVKEENPNA
ncbi:MAG: ribosomal protein S18-alanine N-acetyltransferase [Clostridia bacterium]|nr:ribosomal protein S18-alanine N-acetyltransferase [Clostridia bacterium]